jgi:hypothetical protein
VDRIVESVRPVFCKICFDSVIASPLGRGNPELQGKADYLASGLPRLGLAMTALRAVRPTSPLLACQPLQA